MTSFVRSVARLLLTPTLIVAAAFLVKGYSAPGDGFSAGTLAALAVLMQYAASGRGEARRALRLGGVGVGTAVLGAVVMIAVVFGGPILGGHLLEHWPPAGGGRPPAFGHLELHSALLYDLGIAILVFATIVSVVDLVGNQISRGGER